MAKVRFTQNIQRHLDCPSCEAAGKTVREVLSAVFTQNPRARHYILDEQGELRRHMVVFVDGRPIVDRKDLSDPIDADSELCVMQALSGG